jgi:hypothetical protein
MGTRISVALNLALATVLAFALLGPTPATGGSAVSLNFAAAAFEAVESSTHNNASDTVCNAFVTSQQGAENKGDLNAIDGSYLQEVLLPQGAKVTRLTLFANDNSDQDAWIYLVRKRIDAGLDPQFQGYKVMAQTRSTDAVNGVMRKFSDGSVQGAVVDNSRYFYFLEMVVCDAIEPFAVRVVFAR